MMEPGARTCEVQIDGAWQAVSLTEAHARHGLALKRCPACHGRVTVAGTYMTQVKLNLMHRRGHTGCPLIPKQFKGGARPHPEAVA